MLARSLFAASILLTVTAVARSEVRTKSITYEHGGVTFKGHLAWDDAAKGKRPGILVVHEWWGLNDYARKRAEQLAGLGYVAFACDMYGEGKTTEHPKEAGQMAAEVRKNVEVWQGRAKAALDVLRKQETVDSNKLAAMGYCFGGSTALTLSYTGADLDAVVTFHAALPVPDEKQAGAIKAKLLICHGAADKFIPDKVVGEFRSALEQANVDYALMYLGGAKHSFTVPGVEQKGVDGLAYQAEADRRSWAAMRLHFEEAFSEEK